MKGYHIAGNTNKLGFGQRLLVRILPVRVKRIFLIATLYQFLLEKCKDNITDEDYRPVVESFSGFISNSRELEFPKLFTHTVWDGSVLSQYTVNEITKKKIDLKQVINSIPKWMTYLSPENMVRDVEKVLQALNRNPASRVNW